MFGRGRWYTLKENDTVAYNDCTYQPGGWDKAYRFVAMRIPKEKLPEASKSEKQQIELFEDDRYKYRIFVTDQ